MREETLVLVTRKASKCTLLGIITEEQEVKMEVQVMFDIVIPDIVTSLFVTILLIQVCKLAYFLLPLYMYMGRAHLYQLQYQY